MHAGTMMGSLLPWLLAVPPSATLYARPAQLHAASGHSRTVEPDGLQWQAAVAWASHEHPCMSIFDLDGAEVTAPDEFEEGEVLVTTPMRTCVASLDDRSLPAHLRALGVSLFGSEEELSVLLEDHQMRLLTFQGVPVRVHGRRSATSWWEVIEGEAAMSLNYILDRWPFNQSGVFIESGANAGTNVVLAALRFPHLHIVAIEPVHESFFFMMMSLVDNGVPVLDPSTCALEGLVPGVLALHNGLTKDRRTLHITYDPTISRGATTARSGVHPTMHIVTVKGTTMPDVITTYQITAISLLRLDCEGCEYEVVGEPEWEALGITAMIDFWYEPHTAGLSLVWQG